MLYSKNSELTSIRVGRDDSPIEARPLNLQVNLRNNVHHKQQREYMLVKRFSLIPVLALLGLMSVAAPQQASAQQLKVGYANAEGILPFLPEYNDISQKVQRHVQSSQEVLQAKADAFQADYEKFEKQAELMAA